MPLAKAIGRIASKPFSYIRPSSSRISLQTRHFHGFRHLSSPHTSRNGTIAGVISRQSLSRFLSIQFEPRRPANANGAHEQYERAIPIEAHTFVHVEEPVSSNSLVSVIQSWLGRVFSNKIPKGFGNFYPRDKKDDSKEEEETKSKNDEEGEANEKKEDSGLHSFFGGGGGNGNNNGGGDPNKSLPPEYWLLMALGIMVGFGLLTSMGNRGQEISFQEFLTTFLERGDVERIRVVNKTVAYITRRRSYANAEYADSQPPPVDKEYYFNIGSIEAFERRMEDVQREMGIEPRDYIPIQYVAETNIGTEFLRTLPSLIMIGL
eukprot:CAMPEP_0184489462 /NCGR_PEP_ID=MMETSP0113_2-20130426/15505_1 /TAXON_ID=91329 /ORGANISM="Norrisiella sphaerica, Strain BC52" /LENGTH=319 /DNA_ID=CAMNT_0026872891 /DNA_START=100 /DNA_END=1056 /DNA_ORIENTATION=-